MSQFLETASRIEAAVAAYASVHDDLSTMQIHQWKTMFQMEFVSVYLHTVQALFGHLK